MKSFGYHSKIKLDSREFHVHTGSVVEKSVIICEIFEKGKFITSRHSDFEVRDEDDAGSKESYLKNIAEKLHKDMLEEINMLFFVHSKIRPLKQYLPHFKLASVLYDRNFVPEAIENFVRSIELKNDYIPAYQRLGKCYLRSGQYAEAVKTLEQAYTLQPEFPDTANALGVALSLTHQYDRAIEILQKAIESNPNFDEANFNLGIALFRSSVEEESESDGKAVIPSRVLRYMRALRKLERYQSADWQDTFERVETVINEGNQADILEVLESLQIGLASHIKVNSVIESFYLKFMYGGRELTRNELEIYERKVSEQASERANFADYWNELGTIHMIQCRNLFLKSLSEFEKAVGLNDHYQDANRNLELIRNNKKGFLILLRAILK